MWIKISEIIFYMKIKIFWFVTNRQGLQFRMRGLQYGYGEPLEELYCSEGAG